MTLTSGLWSTSAAALPQSPEQAAMRRCATWCRSLDPVELALPAWALRDNNVAKWARDHGLTVEVRNGRDLAAAIGTGIHPMRLVVHADGFSADELVFCSANLGVGRVVVNSAEQIHLLVSCAVRHRRQRVILSAAGADAVTAVLNGPRLDLVGVYREIDSGKDCFTAFPEVVGDVIAEMADIRRTHALVLTRVWVGGGGFDFAVGPDDLSELGRSIEMTLDDACATLRFPRPVVVVSAGPGGPR
ncbi:type III PLP-dependent enzyme domain-containing protein [Mycolicibacterium neworleansense]|uniref:LysA protein n=1 Tax=Mycolicibacterium neworleansense TaxID=146018 RepID=A0A0H5RWC9_9MYCO|nr:LysA protein [Mycolicibacterium neworleansense]CRZ18425.1 LysA protein [Mycolicibacterium neworleansense]